MEPASFKIQSTFDMSNTLSPVIGGMFTVKKQVMLDSVNAELQIKVFFSTKTYVVTSLIWSTVNSYKSCYSYLCSKHVFGFTEAQKFERKK